MYHSITLSIAILLSACSTYKPDTYLNNTTEMYCPNSHFALCEGNMPTNMQCQCVDRQLQRSIIESIQGII